jgi:hypothetical protein
MSTMLLPPPILASRLLWAGNAVALLGVAGVIAYRVVAMFWGAPADLPAIAPLKVADLAIQPAAPLPGGSRNPYDAGGTPWRTAAGDDAGGSAVGNFKGVVVLPGVRLAVTDRGTQKLGDQLPEGRIVAIDSGRVLVGGEGRATQRLETPGSRRPRLADINRAHAAPRKDTDKP